MTIGSSVPTGDIDTPTSDAPVADGAAPTPGIRHSLPFLDGVRAIAVLFVFIRHAWGLSGQPEIVVRIPWVHTFDLTPYIVMMENGVDLFFVLSGYLLARKWFLSDYSGKPRPSLKRYAHTRFFRIAPPYWIALPIILLVGLYVPPTLIPHAAVFGAKGTAAVLAHLVFLQAIFYPAYGSFGIATPLWTLSVEVVFYIVLPVLVFAFLRNRWVIALPICLAVTLGWLAYIRWSGNWLVAGEGALGGHWMGVDSTVLRTFLAKQFPAHLFDFAVGMAVANLDVRRYLGMKDRMTRMLTNRTAGWISLIVGTIWLLMWMRGLGTMSLEHNYYQELPAMRPDINSARFFFFNEEWTSGLGFALIIHGAACLAGNVQRVLSVKGLTIFGIMGYSIYLLHMPIIWVVNQHLYWYHLASEDAFKHFLQQIAIAGPITFAAAWIFYKIVEQPFHRIAQGKPWHGKDSPRHAHSRSGGATPSAPPAPSGTRATAAPVTTESPAGLTP